MGMESKLMATNTTTRVNSTKERNQGKGSMSGTKAGGSIKEISKMGFSMGEGKYIIIDRFLMRATSNKARR